VTREAIVFITKFLQEIITRMKYVSIIAVTVATTLLLSACGVRAQATPTINALDVQNTAIAVAFTMIAQTQAAVPTATPLPPTPTPIETALPTNTAPSLPLTLEATSTPVPASNSNVDPCQTRILSSSPKGRSTVIRIANTTKVKVTVSLYLNETASHGECGWRTYILAKNSDVVITDLIQGCYNLWAWSDDPKGRFNVSSGTSCINNTDKWTFLISTSTIKFTF